VQINRGAAEKSSTIDFSAKVRLAINGRSYRVKDAPLAGAEAKKKRPAETEPPAAKKSGKEKQ